MYLMSTRRKRRKATRVHPEEFPAAVLPRRATRRTPNLEGVIEVLDIKQAARGRLRMD